MSEDLDVKIQLRRARPLFGPPSRGRSLVPDVARVQSVIVENLVAGARRDIKRKAKRKAQRKARQKSR